jgi:hypothetical protein
MTIKRFLADKDNTITNAFRQNLSTRGTGSNMGESDILEIFSIYGQASTGSQELSRILIHFPVTTDIATARSNEQIPASGSVNFYLRLYNAKHSTTTPTDFAVEVSAISSSWDEGHGLDMEEYKHLEPSNWVSASSTTVWARNGGDYYTSSAQSDPVVSQSYDNGTEDLYMDVTPIVEAMLQNSGTSGHLPDYGFGIKLTDTYEAYASNSVGYDSNFIIHNTGGSARSYYTKRFFGRGSEFFFKRPQIEARWNSNLKDDRGKFYASSSLATGADNLHTLYLYNYVRGELKNIPGVADGSGKIFVKLYTSASTGEVLTPVGSASMTVVDNAVTGGFKETGIYTASFALDTTASTVYDRWFSGSVVYHTSSFSVTKLEAHNNNPTPVYFSNIKNLKGSYHPDEDAKLRVYVRNKNWSPTLYTVASEDIDTTTVEEAYYKIVRIIDNAEIVGYGTGSDKHTQMSYDVSGNYFDLDMDLLEPGYGYSIKLLYKINGAYQEQSEEFKFRVETEQ